MSSSKQSFVGSLIDGRYLVEQELGAGGFAAVYLARDLKMMGRNVVVKVLLDQVLPAEPSEDGEPFDVIKTFRKEAEALSRLDHRNIVTIYDYGEIDGGQPYLILKFIDGISLRQIVEPGGVELRRAAHIVREVAHALTAAHEKGILHRDLKPENVMLQSRGGEEHVIVIDFGIARIQDSVISPKTVATVAAGTIHYMSPEQLTAGDLTFASDIYSLGVMAYELFTGEKPFQPKSPFQLLEMQRAGLTKLPKDLRPELPQAAQDAILRALAFDAAERFPRASDFGDELFRAVLGGPSAPGPAVAPHPTGTSPALSTTRAFEPVGATPEDVNTGGGGPVPAAPPAPPPAHEATAPRRSLRAPLLVAFALLMLCVIAAAAYFAFRSGRQQATGVGAPVSADATPNATPNTTPAIVSPPQGDSGGPPAAGEIVLDYSLTVQRVRDNKEYKEPFESTGREIFENGWLFRMNLWATRPGHLYLLNEGLNAAGRPTYTLLFPTRGNARIEAGQKVQIPEENYYEFTGVAGTEKIWIAWAEQPVPELEALSGLFNPEDGGEVTDPTQIEAVRQFLATGAASKPEVVEDKVKKRTTVKAAGNRLLHLSELEHH